MRHRAVLLAAFAIAAPGVAQKMNAEEFHKRATALQKKGALAVFSGGEIKKLMREGQASGDASRVNRLALEKAGKPPRYCPPSGPQKMTSDEYMKRLDAIPRAERSRIDMTEATTRIMAARFPCK